MEAAKDVMYKGGCEDSQDFCRGHASAGTGQHFSNAVIESFPASSVSYSSVFHCYCRLLSSQEGFLT